MKYTSKSDSLEACRTDCLIAGAKVATKVARSIGAGKFTQTALTDFADKAGQTILIQLGKKSPIRRMLVVGGQEGALSSSDFRKSAVAAASALKSVKGTSALWALAGARVAKQDVYWKVSVGLNAISNAVYAFNEHKSSPANVPTLRSVAAFTDNRSKAATARAVRHAQAASIGLDWARDLGNQPPNVCTPGYLLSEARKLAKKDNVTVSSLDEKRMTELGMGAFMSVTRGSNTPGRMIIVQYKGARRKSDAPTVLVGKGITFDTGGISLKNPAAMDEMKFDMCGAANVLGATRAAIEAKLPINLVTIVAAAENMPSGNASRPGDIVRSHSGKTVEILNTDAEGRLVLCDALSYAARYKPQRVIDVATLTGAAIMALGSHASAVYANDDSLASDLLDAGEYSGDRAWRMPLWEEYGNSLKSRFADVANIGSGGAGSVTAACFLAKFTEDQSWAHLDVAGSAFASGANKGATGRPVGLLFRYLIEQA